MRFSGFLEGLPQRDFLCLCLIGSWDSRRETPYVFVLPGLRSQGTDATADANYE